MLTLFTVPKAFEGHIGTIQRNAIGSWKRAFPTSLILLIGDEEGVRETALANDCVHCPEVRCNEFGTPMLPDVFRIAEDRRDHDWFLFINTDIVLLPDVVPAVEALFQWNQRAVMVGRRTDIAQYDPIEFGAEEWELRLRREADWHGTLREPTALDLFVFPRETYVDIPDFAIGRFSFDNWLVMNPLLRGIPVVDASHDCLLLHQNHGYAHFESESEKQLRRSGELDRHTEVQRNFSLLGGWDRIFGTEEATHRLVHGEIVKGNQRAFWRKQKRVYRREKRQES